LDKRSEFEKKLDAVIGKPLYYCASCLRGVKVTTADGEHTIKRPCGEDCGHEIIAPRKAIAVGEGGMNFKDKVKLSYWQIGALLTGRCV